MLFAAGCLVYKSTNDYLQKQKAKEPPAVKTSSITP